MHTPGDKFRREADGGIVAFVKYFDGGNIIQFQFIGGEYNGNFALILADDFETHFVYIAPPDVDTSPRYLNLAIINIGEATTTLGNLIQRGAKPGECTDVVLALMRAIAALEGRAYVPPPNNTET